MQKRIFVCLLAVAALSLSSRDAAASQYTFGCITNNNAIDCSVLENQLVVTIGLNADNNSMVDFLFTNTGPADSSITDIYFDDPPPLLGAPLTISQSAGVDFSADCAPPSLPGGSPYGFTTSYCVTTDSPTQPNGVNPGEWVQLSYTLQNGATLADVLDALSDGTFTVGIHVQGFSGGGSESGVLTTQPVPEPASLALLGSGAAAAFVRRRRKLA